MYSNGWLDPMCRKFNISQGIISRDRYTKRMKKRKKLAARKKKKRTICKESWCYCDARIRHGVALCPQRRHTTSKSVSLSDRNSAYVFLFTSRGISSTVDSCSAKKFKLRALCETLTRLRQSPQMNQKWVGPLLLGEGGEGEEEEKAARWPQKGRDEKRDSARFHLKNSYGCFTATEIFLKRPLARKVQFYGKWLTSDRLSLWLLFLRLAIDHVFTFSNFRHDTQSHRWRVSRVRF